MVSPIRPTVPDEIDKLGPGKPVASSAAPVVLFRVSVFDSIENEPSQVPLIRSTAPSRAPSIAGCSAEGFAAQSIFVAAADATLATAVTEMTASAIDPAR